MALIYGLIATVMAFFAIDSKKDEPYWKKNVVDLSKHRRIGEAWY